MKSLVGFFLLTFATTWAFWAGYASVPDSTFRGVLLYLGIFTPALVAIALTARAEGRSGVGTLLWRLIQWDVAGRWYLFAIGYMAAIKLAVAVVHRMAAGAWPRFGQESVLLMVGATLLSTMIGGQSGEEIGWRGYALPRLARRMGLGPASVLLGVIWAGWHLPLFYIPGTDVAGQSFPLYLLGVTALSVAIAWLYTNTNGSLLLTMLMHAAINNTTGIVPSAEAVAATNPLRLSASLPGWITVGLLWLCAGHFLVRMRKLERSTIIS